MTDKPNKGVPALRNDEVTGMTEEKQDEVIRESARAPRKEAAKEVLDEQEEQAGETSARRETQDEA